MKKLEHFMLPEHTNKLYTKEAISSISLVRDIAEKLNEIVDSINQLSEIDLTWKHEQEGTIRKGVLFMKDNLLNSLNELMTVLNESGFIDDRIEYHCDYLKERVDSLIKDIVRNNNPSDLEILDARIDKTGVSKKSIGENIRSTFELIQSRLMEKCLESNEFYCSFKNISYLGDEAYNRIANEKMMFLDRDIVAKAPHGYEVSVTTWDGEKKLGDSGWCEKVVIPKNFSSRFCVRKVDDSAIPIIDIYRITFEEESVTINGMNVSNTFEYTSGGFYSDIRLCAKNVRVNKPLTIMCDENYFIAVVVYRIDTDERVYQRATGWCKTITLQSGLEYEINVRKADNSHIFRSDLNNLIFSSYDTNTRLNDNVKSVCHRGFNVGAPENTLSAYKLAKLNGFKYVECDVSFTADSIGVLLHDNTVDRTSNGAGNIRDLTLEEVKKLDFGAWFNEKYLDEKIPTFEEFIVLCRNLGLHPYIEIKYGATKEEIESLVKIVKRYGMKNKVTYISFEHTILTNVFNTDPSARLGFVCNIFTSAELENIEHLKTNHNLFIDLNIGNVTEDSIALAIENDLPIEVWTVNNNKNILNCDPYISGYTTDYVLTECLFSEV